MGEAKSAVELLLAEAYVKRTEVAPISFRDDIAEVLLPPTRLLIRPRRSLADLRGGGGTPLAARVDAAWLPGRLRGRRLVVLLSDGRGNVGAGTTMPSARAFGASGLGAIFVDVSTRPRPEGAELAASMLARDLPLPRADAVTLSNVAKAAQ